MLQINFADNNFTFKSVRENDLDNLEKWLKNNVEDDNIDFSLDEQIFYRRFLEYYLADNECFIEVYVDDELIGSFKGRVEEKKHKKLFIWFFIMDRSKRNEGYGSKVIESIVDYFKNNYSISAVEVGVVENNIEGISFWDSMGFSVSRISQNFFDSDVLKARNLVIMKKTA